MIVVEYDSLPGNKSNINKTQALTLNYVPPQTMLRDCTDEIGRRIQYLGVLRTKEFSRSFNANYGPLTIGPNNKICRINRKEQRKEKIYIKKEKIGEAVVK